MEEEGEDVGAGGELVEVGWVVLRCDGLVIGLYRFSSLADPVLRCKRIEKHDYFCQFTRWST